MKKRNLTVLASSAILAACLVSAPAMLNANADGSFFTMVNGATIRTTPENPGIRFSATMSSDVYSAVVAENSGKSFGMLVVPTDYLAGAEDTDSDGVPNYVEYVSANYTKVVNGETVVLGLMEDLTAYSYDVDEDGTKDICISGAVTGMQFKNMNRDFTGIAFIKTVGTEKTTYEYAIAPTGEYASRNITYVASRAYADPDNAAFESVLTGFVQDGVKQAAGLTKDDAMPEVSVSLNKTEVPYLSDTAVSVQYEVNNQVLDIQLYSTIKQADEDNNVVEFVNNVISPVDLATTPETVATKVAGGINLEVSVPVFAYEQSTNVAIVCDYASQIVLDTTFAVQVDATYDMKATLLAKLAEKAITLKASDAFSKYTTNHNGQPYDIINENGVFTLSGTDEEQAVMSAVRNGDVLLMTTKSQSLGQYNRYVNAYIQGENGNSLLLVQANIDFFNLSAVLANSLIEFTYCEMHTNGAQSTNFANFTYDATDSFYYMPYNFNGHKVVTFRANYTKPIMQAVYDLGYQSMTMKIKHKSAGGLNKNVGTQVITVDGAQGVASVPGQTANMQKWGGTSLTIDVAAFMKYVGKVPVYGKPYVGHVHIQNQTDLKADSAPYAGFSLPVLNLTTA